jgi:hypothetical protein
MVRHNNRRNSRTKLWLKYGYGDLIYAPKSKHFERAVSNFVLDRHLNGDDIVIGLVL